uniref:INCENP_ARK-bind domain-containing protein n=1 Tax=Strongyloides stercoralis TaxID=6248 RepID=A0A0K0EP42_STRER
MEPSGDVPIIARLAFDAEDKLPEDYYNILKNEEIKEKAKHFKKIEPDEWVKAKEFVPSSIETNSKTQDYLVQTFCNNQAINDMAFSFNHEYNPYPYNVPKFHDYNYQIKKNGFIYNHHNHYGRSYHENFSTTSSQSTGSTNSIKKRKKYNNKYRNKKNLSIKVQYQKANDAFNKICSQNSNKNNFLKKSTISRSLNFLSHPSHNNLKLQNNNDFEIKEETKLLCNSCPSLSSKQLFLWNEVLNNMKSIHDKTLCVEKDVKTIVNSCDNNEVIDEKCIRSNKEMKDEDVVMIKNDDLIKQSTMKSSTYEMVDNNTFECLEEAAHFNRIRSKDIRLLEKEINGLKMESSFNEETMVDRINNLPYQHQKMNSNPAYGQKSLQTELEEIENLQFKPVITKYGYPQYDNNFLNVHNHMTTYDIENGYTGTKMVKPNIYYHNNDNAQVDYIDGWEYDETALQNPDYIKKHNIIQSTIPTSLWNRMQWLFRQRHSNIQKITPTIEQDNTCCIIM